MSLTRNSQFLDHGHIVVGVAAAQLLARVLNFKQGVTLYSNVDNTNNIWIGKQGVTADNNATTGGFILTPGSSVDIPIKDLINVFAISDAATQDLMWVGV